MAQLNFTQKTSGGTPYWEATATVNADFNLHIERAKPEVITLEVSTVANGKYTTAFTARAEEVFDQDFDALVYPKYLRIRTWAEPEEGKSYYTEGE